MNYSQAYIVYGLHGPLGPNVVILNRKDKGALSLRTLKEHVGERTRKLHDAIQKNFQVRLKYVISRL